MATYVRQSSFSDGDTITAALFNNEFNQLVNAFNVSTGHTHDGSTTGDGGPISNLFSNALVFGTNANTDVAITFNATTNDGVLTWMEDEDYFKFSDDLLIDSTEKVQFRDTGLYIYSSADGQLDIVADTEVQIAATTIDINGNADISGNLGIGGNLTVTGTTTFNGGTLTLGDSAADNVVFGADVDSNIIPDDDGAYDLGSSTQEWRDLYLDGTAHIDTLDVDVNATIAGTLGVTGVLTGTSLDISGDIDVDGTTNLDVVDIDGAVDMATTLAVAGNVDFNGDLDVDGTTNLDVVDIDGAVDMATTLTVGGEITAASLDISGNVDIDGTLETDALSLNGTTVTASAADINLIDGITNGTVIASKAIVTDANIDITGGRNITISGELDAATLDISGDADIDGTLEADAITIGGVTLAETISDTVGAMVTSNTESGITVAYQDADNTLDFTIGTLNQDTTGTAAIATTVTITDNENTNENNAIVFTSGGDLDGGNLGLESDGDLKYNPSTGTLSATNISVSGTLSTVDSVTMSANNAVVFEGATADAHETTLTVVDATADRTITLPNVSGTVPLLAAASNTQITSTPEELNALDGITAVVGELNALDIGSTAVGTAVASKAVILDSNKDYTGIRNLTISGELDAATLDISGDIDVDGTTNLDVVDIDGAVTQDGGAVFNEASADVDFRVESNGNANMLFVDGGNDKVSIGGTSTDNYEFHVQGTSGSGDNTRFTYTNADANGCTLSIQKVTSSPADNDIIGILQFDSENDADQAVTYAQIRSLMTDVSDGSEDGMLSFHTRGAGSFSEKMRIDSSGRLLLGTTDANPSNNGASGDAGIAFGGTGYIAAARSQETVALFNRMDDDGSIVLFRKNGSDVGSIGTINSTLVIGSGDTGLLFSSGDDVIIPRNSSTAARDAAIDLGDSGNRFKDLHLSGGVLAAGVSTSATHTITNLNITNGGGSAGGTTPRLYSPASAELAMSTGSSERMRINATGVGIGTTSPDCKLHTLESTNNSGSTGLANGGLQIENTNTTSGSWSQLHLRSVSYDAHLRLLNDGTLKIMTDGNTSAMTILDNGNVGIGTSTPTSTLDVRGVFHVGASASTTPVIGRSLAPSGSQGLFITAGVVNGESTTTPAFADNSSSGASIFLAGNAADQYGGNLILKAYGAGSDGNHIIFENRSGTNTFTERMRILSSGELLIGKTVKNNIAITGFELFGNGASQQCRDDGFVTAFNRKTSDGDILEFFQNQVKRGSISISGANTAYNTSSDARLKDVTGKARGLEIVNKLNPVAYNWKHDGKEDEGLIAQEVLKVMPNAVKNPEGDDIYYQMDYSKLVTPLIKAIQEQQTQIDALQSEINLLKGE